MSDLWRRAAAFAARAHQGQFRRDGTTPYASHVARVAMTVAATFGCTDEATLAIAWLHDSIEDTTTDFEDLLDEFGGEVARGVAALTKNAALPHAEREARYDEGLMAAGWKPRLVKLADALDNLSDIGADGRADARRRVIDRANRAIAIARATDGAPACLALAAEIVEQAVGRLAAD